MSAKRTLFALILAASTALAADSSLLNLVMPDAKSVAGIHVSQTLNSAFGQHVLAGSGTDQNFQQFIADTGFDPRRDLTEVVFASNQATGAHGSPLVIARGSFDPVRILNKAKAEGATLTSYHGVNVISHSGESSGDEGWVALLDSTTAVAGQPALVQAAVDRRGAATSLNPQIVAKVTDLSSRMDAWFVTTGPLSLVAPHGMNPQVDGALTSDTLQGVQQTSGGIKFGSIVQIFAEAVTRSNADATALADVIRFFASMVQTNRNDTQAAKFAAILDTMNLSTAANVMNVSLSIAETEIEQLMQSGGHAKASHPRVKKTAAQ